ncbi:hypothetical protein [Planococcus sp. NCCP-2050]|uniref:hypothetical protein n=1 Tax=Planococcus sp. NCCP-2050 TaxID=2944679 RepID=UPI00203C8377|nr:hypothetical protein [Planococcus sp. NCCP-2050]GKW46966.1 hypothetical protein NCCP2050_26580 [Planococcus sp. NCCP-2050]
MFSKYRYEHTKLSIEPRMVEEARNCLAKESKETIKNGERFTKYFLKNSTADGVLVKTVKEIAFDLSIPSYMLVKILEVLEREKVIYRRRGMIGLWKN